MCIHSSQLLMKGRCEAIPYSLSYSYFGYISALYTTSKTCKGCFFKGKSACGLHMQECFQLRKTADKKEHERLVADVSCESAEGLIGSSALPFACCTSDFAIGQMHRKSGAAYWLQILGSEAAVVNSPRKESYT